MLNFTKNSEGMTRFINSVTPQTTIGLENKLLNRKFDKRPIHGQSCPIIEIIKEYHNPYQNIYWVDDLNISIDGMVEQVPYWVSSVKRDINKRYILYGHRYKNLQHLLDVIQYNETDTSFGFYWLTSKLNKPSMGMRFIDEKLNPLSLTIKNLLQYHNITITDTHISCDEETIQLPQKVLDAVFSMKNGTYYYSLVRVGFQSTDERIFTLKKISSKSTSIYRILRLDKKDIPSGMPLCNSIIYLKKIDKYFLIRSAKLLDPQTALLLVSDVFETSR